MRIQRFIGKDMRSVLAQVREALGADAVILSSGRIGSDVEVTAAIDMEVQQAVAQATQAAPAQPVVHAALRYVEGSRHPDSIEARAERAAHGQVTEFHAPPVAAAASTPFSPAVATP